MQAYKVCLQAVIAMLQCQGQYRLEKNLWNLEAVRTNLDLISIWQLHITATSGHHSGPKQVHEGHK